MSTAKKSVQVLEDRVGLWALIALAFLALTGELFEKGFPGWSLLTALITFGAITTSLRFERRVKYVRARHAAGLAPGSRPRVQAISHRKPAPNPRNLGSCTRHQLSDRYSTPRADSQSDYTPH